MNAEFSIGEWVQRRIDGRVGVVHHTESYNDDTMFYVDFGRGQKEDIWAGSTAAWRLHHRTHAHMSTSSRDCDGDYSSGYVVEMSLEERCDTFGDLRFKERVLGYAVTLHGHGTLTVTPAGVEWNEQTEEGYRAVEVRWCDDECDDERSWQRDHRAEEMGY